MGINTTSLQTAQTSLNVVASKFRLDQKSVAGRHHLRLKDGVLFTRVMDFTKFKAVVLRDEKAQNVIREERRAAIDWLETLVAKEYGDGIPDAIQLSKHKSLRGHHAGETMLAHAAVAAAVQQMGFGESILSDKDLTDALRKGAREQVSHMGLSVSPQHRILEAKRYLLRELVLCLVPGICMDMPDADIKKREKAVNDLCDNLHLMPIGDEPNKQLAQAMLKLLEQPNNNLPFDDIPRLCLLLTDKVVQQMTSQDKKTK